MKINKNTVIIIFCLIIIIFIAVLAIPDTPIRPTPPIKSILREIKTAINMYHAEKGTYVKHLKELCKTKHPYFSEVPENPITSLIDWEVCDYNNKNIWYRAIT